MFKPFILARPLLLFVALNLMQNSYATVGGGQSIEFLGYDVKDQKVYLLRHFEDARGRQPQLYYYHLKSHTPDKLIEVKSIYINPENNQIDYDNRGDEVQKSIQFIKNRLEPLISFSAAQFKIQSNVKINTVPSWHAPEETMRQYQYSYTVAHNLLKSKQQQAISYASSLELSQAYKIPRQDKVIVTIRYLAFPEETGYTTEDPVMLLP